MKTGRGGGGGSHVARWWMVLGLPVISLHLSSPIFIDGSCKLKGWVGLNMWWETRWETCPHWAPGVHI